MDWLLGTGHSADIEQLENDAIDASTQENPSVLKSYEELTDGQKVQCHKIIKEILTLKSKQSIRLIIFLTTSANCD